MNNSNARKESELKFIGQSTNEGSCEEREGNLYRSIHSGKRA
jgi:hypothetical protein